MSRPKSILFVCMHNACRSRIAAAIARAKAPISWVIESAGARPSLDVDPKAAELLRRAGLIMGMERPRDLEDMRCCDWDCVVDISCADVCARVPARKRLRWDIPDPLDGPMQLYEGLFMDLEARIARLIGEMS